MTWWQVAFITVPLAWIALEISGIARNVGAIAEELRERRGKP